MIASPASQPAAASPRATPSEEELRVLARMRAIGAREAEARARAGDFAELAVSGDLKLLQELTEEESRLRCELGQAEVRLAAIPVLERRLADLESSLKEARAVCRSVDSVKSKANRRFAEISSRLKATEEGKAALAAEGDALRAQLASTETRVAQHAAAITGLRDKLQAAAARESADAAWRELSERRKEVAVAEARQRFAEEKDAWHAQAARDAEAAKLESDGRVDAFRAQLEKERQELVTVYEARIASQTAAFLREKSEFQDQLVQELMLTHERERKRAAATAAARAATERAASAERFERAMAEARAGVAQEIESARAAASHEVQAARAGSAREVQENRALHARELSELREASRRELAEASGGLKSALKTAEIEVRRAASQRDAALERSAEQRRQYEVVRAEANRLAGELAGLRSELGAAQARCAELDGQLAEAVSGHNLLSRSFIARSRETEDRHARGRARARKAIRAARAVLKSSRDELNLRSEERERQASDIIATDRRAAAAAEHRLRESVRRLRARARGAIRVARAEQERASERYRHIIRLDDRLQDMRSATEAAESTAASAVDRANEAQARTIEAQGRTKRLQLERRRLFELCQELTRELDLVAKTHPLQDYLSHTSAQLGQLELELLKMPAIRPERRELEQAMEKLLAQRGSLTQMLDQSRQRFAKLSDRVQAVFEGACDRFIPPAPSGS